MSDLPGHSRGIIIKMSLGLIKRGSNNWHQTVFKLFHKWDDTRAYLGSGRRHAAFDQFLELYSSLPGGQRNLVFSILFSPPPPLPLGTVQIGLCKLVQGCGCQQGLARSRFHVYRMGFRPQPWWVLDLVQGQGLSNGKISMMADGNLNKKFTECQGADEQNSLH